MLRAFRNTATMAATAVLICANTASADNTWTVTVKNTSKVATDVTILSGGTQVGMKATAVKPDSTSSITIPAKKGSYTWKAEYGGKSCGSHSVDIGGSTAISITCDAAPPASASSQPKPPADSSSQPKKSDVDLLIEEREQRKEFHKLTEQAYQREHWIKQLKDDLKRTMFEEPLQLAKIGYIEQRIKDQESELADIRKRLAELPKGIEDKDEGTARTRR